MKAWQSSAGLTEYVYRKSLYSFGSLSVGAFTGNARLDAEALAMGHFSKSRACEVRHVALSFPPEVGLKEALERLPKMCADWATRYAPDRDWVAGIHHDNGLYHAHMAVANVRDGKALRLLPHMVQGMAKMEFTAHARDAKGTGTPGLRVYTKTTKPLLADVIRTATKEQLNEWIEAGRLRVGRVDKQGVITSVEFDPGDDKRPRRIRLDTLQRLAARDQAAPARAGATARNGTGRDTGLARPRRSRSNRQPAGDFRGRRVRRAVGLRLEPTPSFDAERRPAGAGLQRDFLPGPRLATPRRRRSSPRFNRPAAAAVRGLARILSRSLIDLDSLGKFSVIPINPKILSR